MRWQMQATVETQLKMGLEEGVEDAAAKCLLGEVEGFCHLECEAKKH